MFFLPAGNELHLRETVNLPARVREDYLWKMSKFELESFHLDGNVIKFDVYTYNYDDPLR